MIRALLSAFLYVAVVACGGGGDSSGSAGATGTGGGTSAGGAGGTGAAGAGTAGAGTGGMGAGGGTAGTSAGMAGAGGGSTNPNQYTCNQPGIKACRVYVTVSAQATDNGKKDCMQTAGWMVVDHCPADGLVGCCVTDLGTGCVYDAATATQAMAFCTGPGKTWTTTAPLR